MVEKPKANLKKKKLILNFFYSEQSNYIRKFSKLEKGGRGFRGFSKGKITLKPQPKPRKPTLIQ